MGKVIEIGSIGEDGKLVRTKKLTSEKHERKLEQANSTEDVLDEWFKEWEQGFEEDHLVLCPRCRSQCFPGDATPDGKLLCWTCQFEAPLEDFENGRI